MAAKKKLPRTRRDKYREYNCVEDITGVDSHGSNKYRHSSDIFEDELDGAVQHDSEIPDCMPPGASLGAPPTLLPCGNMVLQLSADEDELFVFPAHSSFELRPSTPPQPYVDEGSDSPGFDEVDMAVTRESKEEKHLPHTYQSESDFQAANRATDVTDMGALRDSAARHLTQPRQLLSFESTGSRCSHDSRKIIRSRKTNRIVLRCKSCWDEVDYTPKSLDYGWFDVICNIISIGSYAADVGSDAWVAYMYYTRRHWWWFSLTLTFIIGPALIMTAFSLKWYVADHKHEKKVKGKSVSHLRWVSRFTFLLFGPVLRYIDSVAYGWKSKKMDEKKLHEKRHWYDLMLYEDADSSLLRLFECFMEAAPQLVLQLYIMCKIGHKVEIFMLAIQALSALTSLASLGWALCAYSKALRFSRQDKANISYRGMAVQFLWRFFTIGARVLALAMFASYFKLWVFLFVGCHWLIMLFWVLWQETKFCDTQFEEFFFNLVAATVHIFCYFNLVEGHTRLRYLFFYSLVYLENLSMILIWYFVSQVENLWYHMPALLAVSVGFFIGIIFQIIYYLKFHPNNMLPDHPSMRIKVCLSLADLRSRPSEKHVSLEHHLEHISMEKDMTIYSVTHGSSGENQTDIPCEIPNMKQNGAQTHPPQRTSASTSEDSAGARDSYAPLINNVRVSKYETAV